MPYPEKTINLWHWWFGSVFAVVLANFPPFLMPHTSKKTINLWHCWLLQSHGPKKGIDLLR